MQSTTGTNELLTRKAVAKLLSVSTQSVIRWEQSGKLPAVRLGAASVRIRRSDVEKLVAESMTAVTR